MTEIDVTSMLSGYIVIKVSQH